MQTRSQTKKLLEEANANANVNANANANVNANALEKQHRVLPDTILHSNLPKKKGLQYEITIDFDEASKAWRANKIPIGDGQFKYKRNCRFPCNETC
jgi:hypothetical protein